MSSPQRDPDDDDLIVETDVPLRDLVMKVDEYRALEEPTGEFHNLTMRVERPKKEPNARDVIFRVDDRDLVVVGFVSRDAMMRWLTQMVQAIQNDTTCEDCGTNIVNRAFRMVDAPGLLFCRACADNRANIPRPVDTGMLLT